MTFGELAMGAEFKIVPWRSGGNSSGWLPGTYYKAPGQYYNAIKVGSRGRETAYVGVNTKVIPTGHTRKVRA